jgi:hypothetical protein
MGAGVRARQRAVHRRQGQNAAIGPADFGANEINDPGIELPTMRGWLLAEV